MRLSCSPRCLQRLLKAEGFRYRRRARKCAMVRSDHQSRLEWALAYEEYNFNKVKLFGDAKFFRMPLAVGGGARTASVWVRPGEAHECWAVGAPRSTAPGAKVFASIFRKNGAYAVSAESYARMSSETATTLLQHALSRAGARAGAVIQLDNDPSFRSAAFRSWLAGRRMSAMPFPARSPDLAIVETLWAQIVRRLERACMRSAVWRRGVSNTAANRDMWRRYVLRICRTHRPAYLRSLVRSLPRRVRRVIVKRGGPTRW